MPDEPLTPPPAGVGTPTNDRMQRIRVGLTGLAVVLLLVVLATALISRVGEAGNASAPANAAAAAKEESKDEPLADLGVVPGAPSNDSEPSPAKGAR